MLQFLFRHGFLWMLKPVSCFLFMINSTGKCQATVLLPDKLKGSVTRRTLYI